MHGRVQMGLLIAGILFPPTMSVASGQGASGARLESGEALPKDVYPDSRNRLALIKREDLNERARREYDSAAANSPAGRPEG